MPEQADHEDPFFGHQDATTGDLVYSRTIPAKKPALGWRLQSSPVDMEDTDEEILARLATHEAGHAIMTASARRPRMELGQAYQHRGSRNGSVSIYAEKNILEYGAESITAYFYQHEMLRQNAPLDYEIVERMLASVGITYVPPITP